MPLPVSLPIPLSQPDLSELERTYVEQVLRSSRLALGPMRERFERQMAALCHTRHAIAVSSGTAALHLIVRALGLGEGDEVITTPFSFVASSNCLLYEGVIPRFVDISPSTLALDHRLIEDTINEKTRGILAVDVFGQPAPWPALTDIARTRNLLLIDDACEAPGGIVGERPIGSWGHAAAFGFYPNKQITTGEGGCITTDDDAVAELCRSMSNQGRAVTEKMEHVRLGFNYRLDEMSAALGCAQLERFPELMARRRAVADLYDAQLSALQEELVLPLPIEGSKKSWFVYVIQLRPGYTRASRDLALKLLREQGIVCAAYFPSIHLQPYYKDRFGYASGDFPVCESISDRSIALPFFTSLSPDEVKYIAQTLKQILPQLPGKARNDSFEYRQPE